MAKDSVEKLRKEVEKILWWKTKEDIKKSSIGTPVRGGVFGGRQMPYERPKNYGDPSNFGLGGSTRNRRDESQGVTQGGSVRNTVMPKGWGEEPTLWDKLKDKWGSASDRYDRTKKRMGQEIQRDDSGRLVIKRAGGIGLGTVIVLAIFLVGGYILYSIASGNALVASVFEAIGLSGPVLQLKSSLGYGWEYLNCVTKNSGDFRIGDVSGSSSFQGFLVGPIFEICDQQLGKTAVEIGCTECFKISVETTNPRVLANRDQSAVFRATISGYEDAKYCYQNVYGDEECKQLENARDAVIKIASREKVGEAVLKGRCAGDGSGEGCVDSGLDPDTLPFSVVGTIKDDGSFCNVNSINGLAGLKYTYNTRGNAPIIVRNKGVRDNPPGSLQPITFPGPIKLDIVPDSFSGDHTYHAGIDTTAFVSVRFRNAGGGDAEIRTLKLTQTPPTGAGELQFECDGFGEMDENGVISIQDDVIKLSPQQRGATVLCTFTLPEVIEGDLPAWNIEGEATYEYQLVKRASSIIVDSSKCEGVAKKSASTASTSEKILFGTSDSEDQASVAGDSGGSGDSSSGDTESCTVVPTEDKVCSSGTYKEWGCCE